MKGLNIRLRDEYIDKACKNSQELGLIASGNGTEIMLQKFKANNIIKVTSNEDSMEFLYILKGAISYEKNSELKTLTEGDSFYIKDLDEAVYFNTDTDVEALYVSTKPLFVRMGANIKELEVIRAAVEKKDLDTYDHDKRVCEYAMLIGRKIGLSDRKLENRIDIFIDLPG